VTVAFVLAFLLLSHCATPLDIDTLGGYGMTMAGYATDKDDLLSRLRKVEGQVRGVAQMIEDDRYCIDVLTQVAAITKGLQTVAVGLFDDHLRHCVADAVAAGGPEADRKLTEATAAVQRLLKS
jgi:DNA-binding FrmR family transcriptional regulator